MISLATLQRQLQSHIIDGDAALADSIDSSAEIPATTRLRIYSEAYRLRLIEALQANFPALERLMGADEFSRMTQLYLSICPSRHFSIRWFGHELPKFLREFADYCEQSWWAELAEWEWKIAAAFDARDADALSITALANVAPDDWPLLRFEVHPSVQRIDLTTNAAAIAKAIGNDEPFPQPVQLAERGQWLIWRQDLGVRFRSLETAEAAALDALCNGATFGELCEAIGAHVDADAVPQLAAQLLRNWIEEKLLIAAATSR
jgi:hypothetical protein